MSLRGLVQRWLQQQKQQRQTMSSPLQQQEDQFDERAVVSRLGIGTSRTNDQHEPQLVRDEGQLKEVLFGKNIIREETVSGRDSATSPLQRMLPARDGDETTEQLQ